ncbi:MAG: hypothetical protein EOO48_01250 [Flavobacterium sp.]|nr:MAG: hypothetical protein EOO48_01250 [Flavobacterium sp.]
MTATTVLLLLLSALIAGGLSFYQYFFKAVNRSDTNLILAFLRFISIFGLLLLLINPVVSHTSYETEKTPLPIVVDNSGSVKELKADAVAMDLYRKLSSDSGLKDKFDIQPYQFDSEFSLLDNPAFNGRQTNLEQVSKSLKSINKNKTFPTVLISDGNQTEGNDYVSSFDSNNKVYPLILGDTTTFLDLRISRLNVNKYAFLKNKFPAEIFVQYSGTKSVSANLTISQGNSILDRQPITFSPQKKSAVINVLLPATATGLQVFKASVTSLEKEKNNYNNSKNFAVEVIDQRTEVAIVASLNHPDVGALKRSIESNAQRKVTIVKPSDVKSLQDYNVVILYQPDASFKQLFDANSAAHVNSWIITGMDTDFNFLNARQNAFTFRMSSQSEEYLADFNTQFNLFALDDTGFSNFPPLQHPFGTVKANANVNVLLSSRIRNIATGSPLMGFSEDKGQRTAFLIGENIWKWRMQSHIDNRSYEKFDVFVDKTIQYLASDNKRRSLVVNHETFYNSGDAIEISAQYFNKNYEFDEKARLSITVTNRATKAVKRYDMLKSTNSFKANLDGLPAGKYTFSVKELNSNTVYNNYFEILDFDIEKQFVNPDVAKLNQLASQTGGKAFMPNQADALIKSLLADENYKAIQKTVTKRIPLIEWFWLMMIIAVCLSAEWFVRKYNGML